MDLRLIWLDYIYIQMRINIFVIASRAVCRTCSERASEQVRMSCRQHGRQPHRRRVFCSQSAVAKHRRHDSHLRRHGRSASSTCPCLIHTQGFRRPGAEALWSAPSSPERLTLTLPPGSDANSPIFGYATECWFIQQTLSNSLFMAARHKKFLLGYFSPPPAAPGGNFLPLPP